MIENKIFKLFNLFLFILTFQISEIKLGEKVAAKIWKLQVETVVHFYHITHCYPFRLGVKPFERVFGYIAFMYLGHIRYEMIDRGCHIQLLMVEWFPSLYVPYSMY